MAETFKAVLPKASSLPADARLSGKNEKISGDLESMTEGKAKGN